MKKYLRFDTIYDTIYEKGGYNDHKHFLNEETRDLITVKVDNPLKKVYVVDILSRIDE